MHWACGEGGNPLWLPFLGLTVIVWGIHKGYGGIHKGYGGIHKGYGGIHKGYGGIHKGYPYGGGGIRGGRPDDFQNAVEMVGHYHVFV